MALVPHDKDKNTKSRQESMRRDARDRHEKIRKELKDKLKRG